MIPNLTGRSECVSGRSRAGDQGHLLVVAASAGLALLGAWVILDRCVLASPRAPEPGVRLVTWKRVRDMPPRAEDGLNVQRTTIRTARMYLGPTPSDEKIAEYRRTGQCDAFHEYLRPEWRGRVDEAVADLDKVLDELADACDDAIEAAKRHIRGTEDELVHRSDRSKEENDKAGRAFIAQAQAAGDMCVSDSYGGAVRSYRLCRTKHGQVYELRRQDADLNGIRQLRLHEEIASLLGREGRAVLDLGEINRCRFRKLWHHPFRKLWHSPQEAAPASVSIS